MTDSEMVLWTRLKNRNIFIIRSRRQHPVDIFVLDFYCHEIKLAIEADGRIHLREKFRNMMKEDRMILKSSTSKCYDLPMNKSLIIRMKSRQRFSTLSTI